MKVYFDTIENQFVLIDRSVDTSNDEVRGILIYEEDVVPSYFKTSKNFFKLRFFYVGVL